MVPPFPILGSLASRSGLTSVLPRLEGSKIRRTLPMTVLRSMLRESAEHGDDLSELRQTRLFERIGEADAGQVLPREEARRRVELVEQLFHDAAEKVLAEIGDLGVLVHEEHAVGARHALADRLPIVGKERSQIDDLDLDALGPELLRGLHAASILDQWP